MATKKTGKKPPPKKKNDGLPSTRYPRRRLLAKIARIRAEIPNIEPSGEEKDDQGKHLFYYTEAQKVFKIYIEAMSRVKSKYVSRREPAISWVRAPKIVSSSFS